MTRDLRKSRCSSSTRLGEMRRKRMSRLRRAETCGSHCVSRFRPPGRDSAENHVRHRKWTLGMPGPRTRWLRDSDDARGRSTACISPLFRRSRRHRFAAKPVDVRSLAFAASTNDRDQTLLAKAPQGRGDRGAATSAGAGEARVGRSCDSLSSVPPQREPDEALGSCQRAESAIHERVDYLEPILGASLRGGAS